MDGPWDARQIFAGLPAEEKASVTMIEYIRGIYGLKTLE
jgi:hypothetical protein